MAQERGNAVKNLECVLKIRFKLSGQLYDPYQVRAVELYDSDPDSGGSPAILATYTPVKESKGVYYITVAVNILDKIGVFYDKWYFTWESGETEDEATQDFYVSETEAAIFYTTKDKVVENLDNVTTGEISNTWMSWADSFIEELCNRDFYVHSGEEQTDYIEEYTSELEILLENYPIIAVNSVYINDVILGTDYYRFKDWGKVVFGVGDYDVTAADGDKVVTNYDYGYSSVPKLVEETATMIVMNYYKAKATTGMMGNSLLVTKSKRFVNYSVSYDMISTDFLKKDSELYQKIQLLERQYKK